MSLLQEYQALHATNSSLHIDDQGYYIIRFALDTTSLNPKIKRLFNSSKGVVVQLKVGANYEESDADEPSVLVYQSSDTDLNSVTLLDVDTDFGIMCWYLTDRIKRIVHVHWEHRSVGDSSSSSSNSNSSIHIIEEYDPALMIEIGSSVEFLMDMGFSVHQVNAALDKYVSIHKASLKPCESKEWIKQLFDQLSNELLMNASDQVPIDDDLTKQVLVTKIVSMMGDATETKPTSTNIATSKPTIPKPTKSTSKAPSISKSKAPVPLPLGMRNPRQQMVNTCWSQLNTNIVSDLSEQQLWRDAARSFLQKLHDYAHLKFNNVMSFCLMCDTYLEMAFNKIPICSNPTCRKMYEKSKTIHGDILNEIKTNPDSVQLLVVLLHATASSDNVKGQSLVSVQGLKANTGILPHPSLPRMFEPFPYGIGFDTTLPNGYKSQDHALLIKTLDNIPKINSLCKYTSEFELALDLDDIDPLIFPLLKWVIRNYCGDIKLLPLDRNIASFGTPLQFKIEQSFPENEQLFANWKHKARSVISGTGSYMAFHGSPISNWHSIIRTGLLGGYVPGIYHALDSATSVPYMNSQPLKSTWANSTWNLTTNLKCLAAIEVADYRTIEPTKIAVSVPGSVWVAFDNSMVVTRYLFLFPNGTTRGANVRADALLDYI
ncbi:Hypothetical protein MVR_LOCUS6 [uncultured virus]|nr:Hypothetical protein MVR_LOCUS6 [uncultured virus]